MARIIGAIVLVMFVIAAIRLAIVALLVAGLIFRTKETVGLLLIGGLFGLLAAYPIGSALCLAAATVAGIAYVARSDRSPATLAVIRIDDPDQD